MLKINIHVVTSTSFSQNVRYGLGAIVGYFAQSVTDCAILFTMFILIIESRYDNITVFKYVRHKKNNAIQSAH
ncbi:hypothetical protein THIOM_004098 [Candidatus Thiomargarita nelsonii]|uniref:Uncharacterized protein n=1 Tax=Candidatus Thiomargarita nelsonii TaxID=1003181 RepID=A0A0A6P030_9GAMM|nr:hypothetical protein THIOM_004098 [Candidatus Thiomargarita nelsonii]